MLLTVKDLQLLLNISRDLAYALMHAHGFPSMKIGGRYFVARDAFERWVQRDGGKEIAGLIVFNIPRGVASGGVF